MGRGQLAQFHKAAHDFNIYLHRMLTAQHAGKHGYTVLVKARGAYFRCWPRFKVTICDLKELISSPLNGNVKSLGNRSMLRFIA